MVEYYARKTFESYEERQQFLEKWRTQKVPEFKIEPIQEVIEITPSVIQTYRAYLAQVKTYKTTQVNPSLAVMQTEVVDDFFPTYPYTNEKVEHTFEKILFNKKDRYFNNDKRITAMKVLLLGPFIHNTPKAITKIMRYIASVA